LIGRCVQGSIRARMFRWPVAAHCCLSNPSLFSRRSIVEARPRVGCRLRLRMQRPASRGALRCSSPWPRRGTRCAPCGRCAQTTATKVLTKRAGARGPRALRSSALHRRRKRQPTHGLGTDCGARCKTRLCSSGRMRDRHPVVRLFPGGVAAVVPAEDGGRAHPGGQGGERAIHGAVGGHERMRSPVILGSLKPRAVGQATAMRRLQACTPTRSSAGRCQCECSSRNPNITTPRPAASQSSCAAVSRQGRRRCSCGSKSATAT